tara:strand:+ start:78294 stop:78650 length:357 start_codon:yes stop_codon:yes gene_type:complete
MGNATQTSAPSLASEAHIRFNAEVMGHLLGVSVAQMVERRLLVPLVGSSNLLRGIMNRSDVDINRIREAQDQYGRGVRGEPGDGSDAYRKGLARREMLERIQDSLRETAGKDERRDQH